MSKYADIQSTLMAEIRRGRYPPTEPLPSENELVERFSVARETVRKAIDGLVHRGIVERRRGSGTYLSERAGRKTGLVGLIIPDASVAAIFSAFSDEIERLCRRNGYRLVKGDLCTTDGSDVAVKARRLAREFVVRRVEGVIFRPIIGEELSKVNREIVRVFRNAKTPLVLLDSDIVQSPERSECDIVAIDNVSAGRRIAEHLIERGRRRVAFMMSGCSIRSNVNWRNRLFGLAGELAIQRVEDAVKILVFSPDDRSALERLYRSRFRPDAIVCGNDETAVQLVQALKAIGRRVPEDVAVVGFDDAGVAAACVQPLTTVHQPSKLIAKNALSTLLARIASPQGVPREIYLPAPLVVRQST